MRIIFNVDAIQSPLTGIGHYALHLAQGLRRHPVISAIRFFSAYRWLSDPEQGLANSPTIATHLRRWTPFKKQAAVLYGTAQQRLFLWRARPLRDWLLHAPNYILPRWSGPSVATIHDLSHLHYPQYHPADRIAYLEAHLPATLAQADALITVSDFVRREIIEQLGIPRERIIRVYNGVDATFHPYPLTDLTPMLARYHLANSSYLLVVATLEPRKNLLRLADAYSRLPSVLQRRHPLIIIGARGWLTDELEKRLAPMERKDQVRRLGYIPQEDLPLLYAGAWAFAFPSIYEGFGLPLLEAMRSGIPTLTANRSSLPEIAGDAALLVDPEDVNAITAGLERLLTDAQWRAQAIKKGLQQAGSFSWERCIEETVAVYRVVLHE